MKIFRLKGGHYVATHSRLTPDPPYVHANRAYSTDGEESQRAPSERTISEYTIVHEKASPPGHTTPGSTAGHQHKSRLKSSSAYHHHNHHQPHHNLLMDTLTVDGNLGKRMSSSGSGGSTSGGRPPPMRNFLSMHNNYDQSIDASSDIYVTSGAYKAPSEIRYNIKEYQKKQKIL